MTRKLLTLALFVCLTIPALSQVDSTAADTDRGLMSRFRQRGRELPERKGEIRYVQSERVAIMDEYLRAHPIKHDGYRIQLVFGSRSLVSSKKGSFRMAFDYSAYEDYLAPNFRLRVGDFMTRYQAEAALRKVRTKFPNAYIVRDKIEVPKELRD